MSSATNKQRVLFMSVSNFYCYGYKSELTMHRTHIEQIRWSSPKHRQGRWKLQEFGWANPELSQNNFWTNVLPGHLCPLSLISDAGTGGGGPGGPLAPQYLADQLTLFELGRADYPHLLLLAPPQCFSPSGITEVHTYVVKFICQKYTSRLESMYLVHKMIQTLQCLHVTHIIAFFCLFVLLIKQDMG